MTIHILSMHTWLELPYETREKLRVTFKIPKSSCTEVVDNHVVCDGTLMKDLMELTTERMQNFLSRGGSICEETDFMKLFDLTLEKLNKPEVEVKKAEEIKEIKTINTRKNVK